LFEQRFVFDYEINARVKLHDEFCFEETMDLSSLLSSSSPSVYELIAVMVHSGSAVGGHYYAYIKDVQAIDTDKQWFEFNDARVSAISLEDMRRGSFGGANKASAYMLMYRKQCDSTMADAEAPLPLQEQVCSILFFCLFFVDGFYLRFY
jgi:ubiquitin carboxyl-terminal hydrolase 47